jgi:hypothetical protein
MKFPLVVTTIWAEAKARKRVMKIGNCEDAEEPNPFPSGKGNKRGGAMRDEEKGEQ